MAWIHQTHGIPLQLADTPAGSGFGWHGMGGNAWGGHPGCPGDQRKAQRYTILVAAKAILQPAPAPAPKSQPAQPIHPKAPPWPLPANHYFGLITGPAASHGGYYVSERPFIVQIQRRLQAMGYAPRTPGWADGIYEQPTQNAVTRWQHAKWAKYTSRYGEVWSDDWQRLFT